MGLTLFCRGTVLLAGAAEPTATLATVPNGKLTINLPAQSAVMLTLE